MNVYRYLMEGKEESPAPALLMPDHVYAYRDLARAADAIRHFLLRHDGKAGDRVLLVAENGFFWVAGYLGILRAGLVCVPLSPRSSAEHVGYIRMVTEARFACLDSSALRTFSSLLQGLVAVTENAVSSIAENSPGSVCGRAQESSAPSSHVQPGDMAALMFTSGTTGTPRGVMVSAGNIIANTDSIIASLSLTQDDRIMSVLPFHYCFGTSLLHTHLRIGGSLVVEPRFLYPDAVLKRMQESGCTGFAGVPSHYQILLRRSNLAAMTFPRLRYVQQAGGHLPQSFIRELQQALPGVNIYIMYGQTEATARLTCMPAGVIDQKIGSVGRAIPGVSLRVLNESGLPVAAGETGQIVAEGANITLGYWRDEEETARRFRDGTLYTGDLATIDDDGYIYIVDRLSDFVKCGGQRVSCRYIEDLLLESGSLVEAAVVGIPDPVLGEAVKAFVVPRNRKPNGVAEDLLKRCRSHLPPPLVPKQIAVVDALPKNQSGKVMKKELRVLDTAHL